MPTSGNTEHAARLPDPPHRAVLLAHTLPDGSAHLDWMIETRIRLPGAKSPRHRLQTFRVAVRIDLPPDAPFLAVPLPPHRDAYLTYEGPVSGDRGEVRRVAEGVQQHATPHICEIRWDTGRTVRYLFGPAPGHREDDRVLVSPREA